jgi:hypothetical protein
MLTRALRSNEAGQQAIASAIPLGLFADPQRRDLRQKRCDSKGLERRAVRGAKARAAWSSFCFP